jgi:heptosyltransferase II
MTTRALVIAPQWLGDAVMTEPLLRSLQARGERITVAAIASVAALYRAMPQVSAVIELPFERGSLQIKPRLAFAKQHLTGRFDVAYVCPNSFKSALLPWMAGIPQRVGYVGELRFGLLTHRLANPSRQQRPPMLALYSALAQVASGSHWGGASAAGADPSVGTNANTNQHIAPQNPRLTVDAQTQTQVLRQHQLQAKAYVVLAPGAEYGAAKRWPASHFAQLAAQLHRPVVLLGSAKEFDLCQSIVNDTHAHSASQWFAGAGQAAAPPVLNLAGVTRLSEALALIAGAAHVVSNDSGLMHIAAALRVPQVALFGSSSPEHTPPLSVAAQVLWLKNEPAYQPALDCAPCFKRECPLGHTRCLNDISPARVAALCDRGLH